MRPAAAVSAAAAAAAAVALVAAALVVGSATAAPAPAPAWDLFYAFDYWGQEPEVFFDSLNGYSKPFPIAHPVGANDHNLVAGAKFGKGAVKFTGVDMGVLSPGVPLGPDTSFTVCLWVNPGASNAAAADRVLFSSSWGDGNIQAVVLNTGTHNIELAAKSAAQAAFSRSGGVTIAPAGQWSHVCVVKEALLWTLYLNGERTAGLQTEGAMYTGSSQKSLFFGGVPSATEFQYDNTLIVTIDNLRIAYSALSAEQVAALYTSDVGAPDLINFPPHWSAALQLNTSSWGSFIFGSYSNSASSLGSVVYDVPLQRAAAQLTAANQDVTYRYLFGSTEGQVAVTINVPKNASIAPTCAVTVAALCPGFPEVAACRNYQDACYMPDCPAANFWQLDMTNYHMIPMICTEASDRSVTCQESVYVSDQKVTVRADGTPSVLYSKQCSQSMQSYGCNSVTQAYDHVATSNVDDSLFSNAHLALCNQQSSFCSSLCHNHGTCDPANAGACICNAGWTGKRCEQPAGDVSCVRGEWSDWTDCSATCGGGTQSRYSGLVPPAGSDIMCTADVIEQTRTCNTQPCRTQCSTCFDGTSGPCQNTANRVCYDFYAGTTTCPAGTSACGAACEQCVGLTVGPCKHLNDGSCMAYMAGTTTCPPGSAPCGAPVPPPAVCGHCWPGTEGSCQAADSVCWTELPTGGCPVGTQSCAHGDVAVAAIVSLDLHLAGASPATVLGSSAFAAGVQSVIGDASISVITASVTAASSSSHRRLAEAGVWTSTGANVGVLLAREASAGGAKTLSGAADSVATGIADGSLAAALSARGLSVSSVSLNSDPQIIQGEMSAVATPTSGVQSNVNDQSEEAPLSSTSAAPSLTVGIAVGCAVGGVVVAAIAAVLAIRRRRHHSHRVMPVRVLVAPVPRMA